jgi:hypothetical protein
MLSSDVHQIHVERSGTQTDSSAAKLMHRFNEEDVEKLMTAVEGQ